jgi:hypothetical protein
MTVGHPRSAKEFTMYIGLGTLVVILAVLVLFMLLRRSHAWPHLPAQ